MHRHSVASMMSLDDEAEDKPINYFYTAITTQNRNRHVSLQRDGKKHHLIESYMRKLLLFHDKFECSHFNESQLQKLLPFDKS